MVTEASDHRSPLLGNTRDASGSSGDAETAAGDKARFAFYNHQHTSRSLLLTVCAATTSIGERVLGVSTCDGLSNELAGGEQLVTRYQAQVLTVGSKLLASLVTAPVRPPTRLRIGARRPELAVTWVLSSVRDAGVSTPASTHKHTLRKSAGGPMAIRLTLWRC